MPKTTTTPAQDKARARLRGRLAELEILHEDLAAQCGVSRATVTRLLREGYPASPHWVADLVRVLRITAEDRELMDAAAASVRGPV